MRLLYPVGPSVATNEQPPDYRASPDFLLDPLDFLKSGDWQQQILLCISWKAFLKHIKTFVSELRINQKKCDDLLTLKLLAPHKNLNAKNKQNDDFFSVFKIYVYML